MNKHVHDALYALACILSIGLVSGLLFTAVMSLFAVAAGV